MLFRSSFVGSLQKVDVGDGFQQVVQRIDFVAVYGILVEGGGKDNAGDVYKRQQYGR